MHGHHQHHDRTPGPAGRRRQDHYDRVAAGPRGRGGGRGRGRYRDDAFGYGRLGFGPGFGRGSKRDRGDVRAAVLALLAEEPMHGYQVITELTERSGGVWRPSPGSVYPTLQALEDQGLVVADQSEGRRVFRLTDAGRAEAETAGDQPKPWERAARGADPDLVDLRGLMAEVAAATMQTARSGSGSQLRTVGQILADTRRRIYLVLADGPSVHEERPAPDARTGDTGDGDGRGGEAPDTGA